MGEIVSSIPDLVIPGQYFQDTNVAQPSDNKGISANNIAALVRDESKSAEFKSKGIQVRIGDYQNFESLKSAFQDVDRLLLISSSAEIAQRFEQHKNVINEMVKHLFYQ